MDMRRVQRLFELQKVDLALDAARKRAKDIDARLTESDALRAARAADRDLQDRLGGLRTRAKDLELQSTALDGKIKSVDDRLYSGAVKNPKELNDLQLDAASLRRQKSSLDDKLLELILEIEQVEQDYAAAHAALARTQDEWQSEQADLIDERARLTDQIAAADAERRTKRADIAPADLALYDQLRAKKRGQVVAPLDEGMCSTCGVQPSASKLTHLRRDDELLACGNCERILIDLE